MQKKYTYKLFHLNCCLLAIYIQNSLHNIHRFPRASSQPKSPLSFCQDGVSCGQEGFRLVFSIASRFCLLSILA